MMVQETSVRIDAPYYVIDGAWLTTKRRSAERALICHNNTIHVNNTLMVTTQRTGLVNDKLPITTKRVAAWMVVIVKALAYEGIVVMIVTVVVVVAHTPRYRFVV